MENYENTQELDSLRQQLKEFKERLNRQEIVSEQLFRKSMDSKLSWVKNAAGWQGVLGLAVLPFFVLVCRNVYHVPYGSIVFIGAMIVCEAVYNFWSMRRLRQDHLSTLDLITVKTEMLAYKRRERMAMLVELPLLLLWVLWFGYDIYSANNDGSEAGHWMGIGMVIGMVIGALLGLAIALTIYFKTLRKVSQVVSEIEEYSRPL